MKKYLLIAVLAASTVACDRKADYDSMTGDIRIENPKGWGAVSGVAYTGIPVNGISVSLTLLEGHGGNVTLSADESAGLYVESQTVELNPDFESTVVTVDVAGTPDNTPGTTRLVLKIEDEKGKTLEYAFYVTVMKAPAFGFIMNDGKVTVTSDSYARHYDYSLLQAPYDSKEEVFGFVFPYEFGFGRTIELDSYELWSIGKGNSETLLKAADGWALELDSPQLAEGTEHSQFKLLLEGSSDERFDIELRALRLIVHPINPEDDDIVLEEGNDLAFPPMRVRAFDILWPHNIGKAEPMIIGYDTIHVPSSITGTAGMRILLNQPLGYTTGAENRRPFYYQWGRGDDGHQVFFSNVDGDKSATTVDKSATAAPGHGLFITSTTSPADWHTVESADDKYWTADPGTKGGVNNPCPTGYRVPVNTEIVDHKYFDGLMLPYSGNRSGVGAFTGAANMFVWSCVVNPSNAKQARSIRSTTGGASWDTNLQPRVVGLQVRCINMAE